MSDARLDDRGVVVACPSCGRQNRVLYERLDASVRCAECKSDLAGTATPLDVPDARHFDLLVERAAIPVVVDYWAPWCGPCRMVAPELSKVAARSQGRFLVAKVNTDALSDVGQRFGIRSIPTMAVFAGGREVTRTTGARPAAEIEAFVAQALRAAS
jgi:thioredoxin 2